MKKKRTAKHCSCYDKRKLSLAKYDLARRDDNPSSVKLRKRVPGEIKVGLLSDLLPPRHKERVPSVHGLMRRLQRKTENQVGFLRTGISRHLSEDGDGERIGHLNVLCRPQRQVGHSESASAIQ